MYSLSNGTASLTGRAWRDSLSTERALAFNSSLPQGQHLLLIDGIAVRLNERARSGSQLLFLTPSYLLHSSRDDVGYIPHPTFFDIQCQNSHGAIVLPL
jgi:hypothetical protein